MHIIKQKAERMITIKPSVNEIPLKKKIFDSNVDFDLEFEETLPDYLPDIGRLIRVECTPYTDSCTADSEKMTVTGRAVCDVLYESGNSGKLKCHTAVTEFSQNTDLPKNTLADLSCRCSLFCRKISCRLLSPKKIAVKALICMSLVCEGNASAKAVSAEDGNGLWFRKKSLLLDGTEQTVTEEYTFSESLPLTQGEKEIGDIIFGSVSLIPPQISCSDGSISVRTNADVRVLYESEEAEPEYIMSTKTIPVSIDYSNPVIEGEKAPFAVLEAADTKVTGELDQYGESRIIKVSFKVKMTLSIPKVCEYTLASDMFSEEAETVCETENITFQKHFYTLDKNFSIESELSPTEPILREILSSDAKSFDAKAEKSADGVDISGNIVMSVLGKTDDGISSFDYSIPYNQHFQCPVPESFLCAVPSVNPFDVTASLHSDGSVSARIIADAFTEISEECEESFISSAEAGKEHEKNDDGYSLVFCFPSEKDDLWAVAKKYYVNPKTISDANPGHFGENGENIRKGVPVLIKSNKQ